MLAVVSLLVAGCFLVEAMSDLPDSSVPTRYTVTHEAVFDIVIKENAQTDEILSEGRLIIGLFGDIVPMTVLNFASITNGVVRANVSRRWADEKSDGTDFVLDEFHL